MRKRYWLWVIALFAINVVNAGESEGLRLAKALSEVYAEIAERVSSAVVTIEAEKKMEGDEELGFSMPPNIPPQFREFFRRQAPRQRQRAQGTGSGFIIDKDGLILTNSHVVEGASKIKVYLGNGAELYADIVGTDPKTDIAVIRLKDFSPDQIIIAKLGNSDNVKAGNIVMAIGAPFGLKQTVTCGIVSATKRNRLGAGELRSVMYQDFIQTDATINPGNSGGPLVNLDGEVIGINSAISTASGGSDGVGFSIPINMAKTIKDELVKSGSVTRGYLGVGIRDITPEMKKAMPELKGGVMVLQTFPNTPATIGGMQVGDILLSYNGKTLDDVNHLQNLVAQTVIGETAKVKISRAGEMMELSIPIAKQPKRMTYDGNDDGEEEDNSDEEKNNSQRYRSELLGMEIVPLNFASADEKKMYEGAKGLVVAAIDNDGIADKAGLEKGALLIMIDQRAVTTVEEFKQAEKSLANKKAALVLYRFGVRNDIVTLELGK